MGKIATRWLIRLILSALVAWMMMYILPLPETRRVYVMLTLILLMAIAAIRADEFV